MSETNAAIGATLDAFFCQLHACGVREAVVSPGSRSTPLAMKALEHLEQVWVDVDERGAAFFALGMAKASGRPVPLICTSGTAVANWYPAVLEAEAAYVPLLFLSADRPAHLQNVGAPQTTNQQEMFGSHVRLFRHMPEMRGVSADEGEKWQGDFAAAARGAIEVACGWDGGVRGPVHLNFPFDEPLKPAPRNAAYEACVKPMSAIAKDMSDEFSVKPEMPTSDEIQVILDAIAGKKTVIIAGEGAAESHDDALCLVNLAHTLAVPILADPLSGLRVYQDSHIVTNYDSICTREGEPYTEAIIRFGRWNVSKRLVTSMAKQASVHVVVDENEPLDYTHTSTIRIRAVPLIFARALTRAYETSQQACVSTIDEWMQAEKRAHERLAAVTQAGDDFEGSYVAKMLELIPDNSTLWAGNSMAIRALDTFMEHSPVRVLANRGLNGIDGTTSSALGAHTALAPAPTTLLVGDLTLLHDLNAFALAPELRRAGIDSPFVIVCLNNNGGAIFDMLPQRSSEPYFERLFLTPQEVDFAGVAQMFGVDYARVETVADFARSYSEAMEREEISLIDVRVPLAGVPERYACFW